MNWSHYSRGEEVNGTERKKPIIKIFVSHRIDQVSEKLMIPYI